MSVAESWPFEIHVQIIPFHVSEAPPPALPGHSPSQFVGAGSSLDQPPTDAVPETAKILIKIQHKNVTFATDL